MHCLVIGGTRFIGPRVVKELHSRGWKVTVLHRGHHNAELPVGVDEIVDARFGIPVTEIPSDVRSLAPDVVLLMIAMGQKDAAAAIDAFDGHTQRIVAISSGDVYRAYGRFTNGEPGPLEPMPLLEDSPLREKLYPYRGAADSNDALEYWYDKILVERAVMGCEGMAGTVLRLPKVYGPGENDNLATVFGFRSHPEWRWTHGHVDNVAHAISLAVVDERSAGKVFNVGERHTPTVAERINYLPWIDVMEGDTTGKCMLQDIVYDTEKIRQTLGFEEVVDERAAMVDVVRE